MSSNKQNHFYNEEAAYAYLENLRWPTGPVCPHCGVVNHAYKLKKTGLYRCAEKACRKNFTVRVGTVFEDSPLPLHKWLFAFYLMCASKKGISSHQLHRMLGITYKSAWFLTHRIREAMKDGGTGILGGGGHPVEVDETYWGTSKEKPKGARGYDHKMKLVSLVERGGNKQTIHMPKVTAATLRPVLMAKVSPKARLMTDEASVYTKVGREFAEHGVVVHSAKEYSRGDVTTNTVESSFALLKRGLYGTFHHVGEQHLQRYATEFDFRWNHRKTTDAERADAALRGSGGRRLTYREIDT